MDETMNKMEETKDLDEQINDELCDEAEKVSSDEWFRSRIIALLKAARDLTDDLYNASAQKYQEEICGITDDISQAIRELKNLW